MDAEQIIAELVAALERARPYIPTSMNDNRKLDAKLLSRETLAIVDKALANAKVRA